MQVQATRQLHPLLWLGGIALIVFCGAGIAAFMGWIPGSAGKPAEPQIAQKAPAAPRAAARVVAVCTECGVVQSVQEIDTKGEGSGIGAVGGAVVGGVLGNQVGRGDGRKVATVIGAVGGAVAGHEIEKHVKSTKSFAITVRFDDGSSRVITEPGTTAWRAGDRVKVIGGVIESNA